MSAKKIRRLANKEAIKIMGENLRGQQNVEEHISSRVDIGNVFAEFLESNESENERHLFSSDIDCESERNEYSICEELGKWANEYSISFSAFNALLRCLNKCEVRMPKDGRKILKTPLEIVHVPQITVPISIIEELRNEVKSLKTALEASNSKMESLTEEVQQCRKNMVKLTEEVIAVKLESKKHHSSTNYDHNPIFSKLPFLTLEDFTNFNNDLENNAELLEEFKNFIGKIDSDGQTQFLRRAIRKIFTDKLACLFSWKGTKNKPNAEKLFVTSVIKNICQVKYETADKEVNSILQKYFVYSNERLKKRKPKEN